MHSLPSDVTDVDRQRDRVADLDAVVQL